MILPKTSAEIAPRRGFRWGMDLFRAYARNLKAPLPQERRGERVLFGLAQPLLGLRTVLSDWHLLSEALVLAAWLAAFCAFVARFAALVRFRLGFGACGPREYPLSTSLKRALEQVIIVAIGVRPACGHLEDPAVDRRGPSQIVLAAWGVHWVVVDALDDARVLLPGETIRSAEAQDRAAESPWFVRLFHAAADRIPLRPVGRLLHLFARFCDRMSLPWRGEIALMEATPSLALGFGLATAALLGTPVLYLLFRPTVIAASSHLLGHLEAQGAALHRGSEASRMG